jgi:hypothetical protein
MTDVALGPADGVAFVGLMRRYVINYTNAHDQTQTKFIMEPDYALRMGDHFIAGRDGAYAAATRKQLEQFPGLGLTVHEICTSGERLVMRFSEHGASTRHGGATAVWGGIGLYRWNGRRLTANNVEQDYVSRARQLATGQPLSVESPAIAPWDTVAAGTDPGAVNIVTRWLNDSGVDRTPAVLLDDQWAGVPPQKPLEQESITINDIFSCGAVVAFHATQHGRVIGEPDSPIAAHAGQKAQLHMAGIVHLQNDVVAQGRVIRNRLEFRRSLERNAAANILGPGVAGRRD